MDYETEVLRFLREEPSLVIYNKLLKELGAAPAMFIAYLAEKFFRVSPTFDGYITVSIEEMEKEIITLTIEILNFHKGDSSSYEDRMQHKKKILENINTFIKIK